MNAQPVIRVDRRDGVMTIELHRPDRKNAITSALVEALIVELQQTAGNTADRVVIITGAGGAFCSGMDLAEPPVPDELTFMRRVGALCVLLRGLPKPTIAKVQGPAYGFGANFALCCDLVLAGSSAVFGEIFAERGLSIDGGGSWTLPRLVGIAKAKEILFFGARIRAAEAERLGMVNRAVPDSELDSLCTEWAERLVAGPARALSVMKGLVNTANESSFAQSIEDEAIAQAFCFGSTEVKEGMRAFAQGRPANFRSVT